MTGFFKNDMKHQLEYQTKSQSVKYQTKSQSVSALKTLAIASMLTTTKEVDLFNENLPMSKKLNESMARNNEFGTMLKSICNELTN